MTLLVLVGASYGGWKWWQVEQFRARGGTQGGGIQVEGPPLEEFELTECSGQPFRSRDMLGKVWVTTFFFTSCPGACPRLNANIHYLNSLKELHDVVWVSITVDPDTDTLPVLRAYAEKMQADPKRWLFCRGDLDYVTRVGQDFMKLQLGWKGHQDYAVVVDRQGEVRGMFDATSHSQSLRLRTLLLKCLAEPGPEVGAAKGPGMVSAKGDSAKGVPAKGGPAKGAGVGASGQDPPSEAGNTRPNSAAQPAGPTAQPTGPTAQPTGPTAQPAGPTAQPTGPATQSAPVADPVHQPAAAAEG